MKRYDKSPYEFSGFKISASQILPIITKPYPNELFSSWVIRCSHRHELKPYVFGKFVWGSVAIWNRDIDKSIKSSSLSFIAELNRVSYHTAFQTTLKSYEGILFDQLYENGVQDFITTAGVYHRKRKRMALMYCPICLKENPYFRKVWRVAIVCCCTRCNVYLRDKCPHCSEAIIPFRLNIEKKRLFQDFPLNICWNCKNDLTEAVLIPVERNILKLTKAIEQRLKIDHGQAIFFNRLQFLKRILVSNRKLISHLKTLQVCDIPTQDKPLRNTLFELLSIEDRIEILKGIAFFMDKWPNRFKTFIKAYNLNYSELVQEQRHKDFYPDDLQSVLKSKAS